jgi:hypothetical protein
MTIARINQLYELGAISPAEHDLLIRKVVGIERRISISAVLCLLCAMAGWALMLTFTRNGERFGLLEDGESRQIAGLILAPLSLVFFFVAKETIRRDDTLKGMSIAWMGLGMALLILSIVVPVLLMTL